VSERAEAAQPEEPKPGCGQCTYFDPHETPRENGIEGRCVVNPPRAIPGRWPGVRRSEWCGRFTAADGSLARYVSKESIRKARRRLRDLAALGGATPDQLEEIARRITPGRDEEADPDPDTRALRDVARPA
jgi:hypothetical protein